MTKFEWPTIQPNETRAQFTGRRKRAINEWNKSLNLQPGEPVDFGKRGARFRPSMIDKHAPQIFRRLTGEALAEFLEYEAKEKQRSEEMAANRKAHEAIYARPEARDASSIRYLIEENLGVIIDRLTPAEWSEFRRKLEVKL